MLNQSSKGQHVCLTADLVPCRIPDPEASKPDDWDEDAPRQIEDPEAEKPEGWLDDEPEEIDDPGMHLHSATLHLHPATFLLQGSACHSNYQNCVAAVAGKISNMLCIRAICILAAGVRS